MTRCAWAKQARGTRTRGRYGVGVVIDYPTGQEPDLWEPSPEVEAHRFVLGRVAQATVAAPPLIAICMNPSTAFSTTSDKTVNRLIRASVDNGQPGWVMLNLYPERATNAADLSTYDSGLSAANCAVIERMLGQFGVTDVLVAWGGLKYETLRLAKTDVLDTLGRLGVTPYTFDGLTVGHEPRHPMPRRKPLVMGGTKRYLSWSGTRLVEVMP